MNTWLFQANPDRFDLDGYLAADLETITWVVRQHRDKVAPGDAVFIWKAQGGSKEASGVVAECRVVSPVERGKGDAASLLFWDKGTEIKSEPRVELLVVRIASQQEILKRGWLKEDPALSEMAIFKMAQGTNHLVTELQAKRLRALWARVGKDWSWRDSIAGFWAFAETKGSAVSKLSGSPVVQVALAIDRVVGDVYNKVMNFQAIAPNDEHLGLRGAGEVDRKVWSTFVDPADGQIHRHLLDAEVKRLGLCFADDSSSIVLDSSRNTAIAGSLEMLVKKYQRALASGAFKALPSVVTSQTQSFIRNPLVVQIARIRAASKCEIPGCTVPSFIAEAGATFCEIHHVVPLSEGGEDRIENVICLCPVHHREAHHGLERLALRDEMLRVRSAD